MGYISTASEERDRNFRISLENTLKEVQDNHFYKKLLKEKDELKYKVTYLENRLEDVFKYGVDMNNRLRNTNDTITNAL